LNEAQLMHIQKLEWLEAYIKAREAAFLNIKSAWRGSGLLPFQPQKVIRAATLPLTYVKPQRPKTPTEHDIFKKVFQTSSPPDFNTLQKANSVLSKALNEDILNTPTKSYIHKLVDETEQLNTHYILQKREVENLHNITQKRRAQKGKRAILKGQFHVSTDELRSQVIEAEAATAASKKSKTVAQPLTDKVTIEEMDELDEEELYNSDLDELGW
jgi:hypothetical protein